MSWWSLGEHSGYTGDQLALHRVECAFCGESGNFTHKSHHERENSETKKKLNYETLQCVQCGNFTAVFWSSSGRLHDFVQMPRPTRTTKHPKHWPTDVGRYWLQAKRSLEGRNWDAAALMARSAIQRILRQYEASGKTLKDEIDDLANKGLLPPIMKEWAHEVRELGNEGAHPKPESDGTSEADASAVVKYLTMLARLLYDLPHEIDAFRERKKRESK